MVVAFCFRRAGVREGRLILGRFVLKLRLPIVLALLQGVLVAAQVSLPKVLSSHMVVERDVPVHVWGKAAPGRVVSVSFRGESRSTATGPMGKWSVYLKPGVAGGPFALTVTSNAANGTAQTITLDDVLVGDVWLASGQSNMEFAMRQAETAAQDLPQAANARIRLLMVKKKASVYPLDDVETEGWAASTPETAKDFSAVAWYFAREIEQREHVPVGVIDSTWGGTVADAWTREAALGADAALTPVFVSWGRMTERETDALAREKDEQRQRDEAKAAGKPEPAFPWHPQLESWGPGNLWNGMIAPLKPMAIRGVIWYQGESNSALERAPLYGRVFSTMIEDWRHAVGHGRFSVSVCADFEFQVECHGGLGGAAGAAVEDVGPAQHGHGRDHRYWEPGQRAPDRQGGCGTKAGAGGARAQLWGGGGVRGAHVPAGDAGGRGDSRLV